jgi:hypothetical protein
MVPARPNLKRVREILEKANGSGAPDHDGAGKFWNLSLARLLTLSVYDVRVIDLQNRSDPRKSGLIQAIRGLPPFAGSPFRRMPQDRPPIQETEIQEIEHWIRLGCPEE